MADSDPQSQPTEKAEDEILNQVQNDEEAVQNDESKPVIADSDPQSQPTQPVIADSDPQSQPIESTKPLHHISLRTNLLYWLTGMANIGFEWNPGTSQVGIVVNGGYSPVGGADWEYAIGGWYISPEVRYYIPANEKWFLGLEGIVQGFNFKLADTGYQGTLFGGGVLGGYKMNISDLLDMDFTLGLGYRSLHYDTYYHSSDVNILKQAGLSQNRVLPIQIGVNLIWKIQ
ncbi:MAG: DUF3575 domain-containing protein [Rikenellaceae bacterium]